MTPPISVCMIAPGTGLKNIPGCIMKSKDENKLKIISKIKTIILGRKG